MRAPWSTPMRLRGLELLFMSQGTSMVRERFYRVGRQVMVRILEPHDAALLPRRARSGLPTRSVDGWGQTSELQQCCRAFPPPPSWAWWVIR